MNPSDIATLQAFLLALLQLDVPLSDELRQDIYNVGIALTNHHQEVIQQIPDLAKRHDQLNSLYQDYYGRLHQQSRVQTQSMSMAVPLPDSTQMALEAMAATILTAKDFKEATTCLVKRLKNQENFSQRASVDIKVFLGDLQRSLATSDARAIAVLKALEKRPLTIKDLVYVVGLSFEQAWAIVESLWDEGYIDRTAGSVLHKLFPRLRTRLRERREIDADTYFTLTSRGHFFLHPVISFGRHEGSTR